MTATATTETESAWDLLREAAGRPGRGIPDHDEGQSIVTAARRRARNHDDLTRALEAIDPNQSRFPSMTGLLVLWEARKANA